MNSFFEDIKNKKKIFLNNAELELFPKTNHENFFSKIWEGKKELIKEYEELSNLYYIILPEISSKLNQYHNKNYNERFWEILIGYWLHHFISKYLEKLNSLKFFFDNYKKEELKFYVKKYNNLKFIPLEFVDYGYYQYDHDLNSNCQKEILEFLDFKNFSILEDKDNYSGIENIKKKLKKNAKKNFLNSLQKIKNIRNQKIVAYKTKLKFFEKFKFNFIIGEGINFFPENLECYNYINIFEKTKLDITFRNFENTNNNTFKDFVLKKCMFYIPTVFLENFKNHKTIIDQLNLPSNPKVILTSNGFQNSSFYSRYIAEKIKAGTKLVISQHGGVYGQQRNHFPTYFENKVSDKFLSWGWTENGQIPFMMLKKIDKFNNNKQKNILFEVRPHRIYPKRTEILESQFQTSNYYNQCGKLLRMIRGTSVEKNFYIKLSPKGYDFDEEKIFKNSNPKVKFVNRYSPMTEARKNASLLIFSTISTGHLEATASNYPFMILNVYPNYFKSEIEDIFMEMSKLGILHFNVESLFMTLKNIENDIYSWWSSETLQTFIRKYRNNYANVENEFKLQKLKKVLKF